MRIFAERRILIVMNLRQFPKVELHRHLELSLRHSTIKELGPQAGFHLKTHQDFADKFLISQPMKDLGSVLSKFLDTQKLLSSEEIIERISYEACADAYNEGVRILELRYAPTFITMNHKNLDFQKAHDAVVRGCARAEKEFQMAVGLIVVIQRILPVDVGREVVEFSIANKKDICALDLADNEVGFDSKPFSKIFEKAKSEGLGITVHSGEADVPKAPRYVRDAIDFLGAQRIGHGLQIHKDQKMIDYVKEKGVVLELCPTSNWLTNAVPSLNEHPFRKLMEAGVKTTINSDDPGIFNIDLTNEYKVLADLHKFTEVEFNQCNDIAAAASFIPHEKKQKVWPRFFRSLF